MNLVAGARLGPYEILSALGAGGMGAVYKARDTRLDRIVAIKILHDQFSERFEREAHAIAALNHPHICQLYDVGPNFLVMEFVDGAPIGPGDTPQNIFDMALQMVDGLAAAHAVGIVHRDLKPANILVSASGRITILDFGLATMAASADNESRQTIAMTGPGTTLGTAAYMSPEQARGLPVDARSDLWSLGVILYELATGVRPFDGPTAPVIFEALLGKPLIPARDVNAQVPLALDRIITRLLEKNRDLRYQSAVDLRADLKRIARDSDSAVDAATRQPAPRWLRYTVPAVGAVAVALGAAAIKFFPFTTPQITNPSEYTQITNFIDSATAPSLSADGRMITFIRGGEYFLSTGQIYVKPLPRGESMRLTNEATPKYAPVFTPDGGRIAYTLRPSSTAWDTWTVPIRGGPPTRLLPNASGLTWLDDHRVLFSEIKTGLHMGIVTATDSRAASREIYFPAHERAMAHYSYASPNGQAALVVEMDRSSAWAPCRLVALNGTVAAREVGPQGSCRYAAWSPDGRWMYFGAEVDAGAHLWRQRFPDGTPEQITFGPTAETGIAIDPDGKSLITSIGSTQSTIWVHDPTGDHAVSSEGFAFDPKLSVDGKHVFYRLRQNSTSSAELRVVDLASGATDTVLPGTEIQNYDISRDGTEVAFTSTPNRVAQVWVVALDRRSPPRLVIDAGDRVAFAANGALIYSVLEGKINVLYRVNKDGTGRARITDLPITDGSGVSPDGEWVASGIAGVTNGRPSVMTMAIPVHGGTPRVICQESCIVQWSGDGRFLYVRLGTAGARTEDDTFVVPIPAGRPLPNLPAAGIGSADAWRALPGVRVIAHDTVYAGADPSTYVFVKRDLQRNLFRIPIH